MPSRRASIRTTTMVAAFTTLPQANARYPIPYQANSTLATWPTTRPMVCIHKIFGMAISRYRSAVTGVANGRNTNVSASTARTLATPGSSKKWAMGCRSNSVSTHMDQPTTSATPKAARIRVRSSCFSCIRYSLIPNSRTTFAIAMNAADSENTPTCAGVSRRARIIETTR